MGSARAMVRAARTLHQPSRATAGEYADGTCAYCEDAPELTLIERYRDTLNGSKGKVWLHDHPDAYPTCSTCAAGYDGREDWPCTTARLLGADDNGYAELAP